MSTVGERINFIRDNFPDIDSVDPKKDFMYLRKVKRKLFEAGFYKVKYLSEIHDTSIMNLVYRVQGVAVYRHNAEGSNA